MKRLVILLSIVLAAVLGLGLYVGMAKDPAPTAPPDGGEKGEPPTPLQTSVPDNEHPTMVGVWPFGDFVQEFREFRNPEFVEGELRPEEQVGAMDIKIRDHPMTIRLEGATTADIVRLLKEHYAQYDSHCHRVRRRRPPRFVVCLPVQRR